ncbi:MAG: alpha-hydroxy-acid oxidizing protein [Spirosomaceae bacterium]|nr:alpha-hydroxy-acid oxidizing protein [Spirosomataceae bacterium]
MSIFKALDYQRQIYLEGFTGRKPVVSPDWGQLEQDAIAKMDKSAAAYIVGGAGLHQTMTHNRTGFDAYRIVPQMLNNVENRDTSVQILDVSLPSPFWLNPIGVSEMVHPEADLAIAKAAAQTGIPMVFSNQASVPMETCAAAMGSSPRFFQLYWSRSRDLVVSLVQRAEQCGCRGIVLTLDTTLLGWRTQDLRLGFLPFLQGKGIAQYTSDPVFQRLIDDELAKPKDSTDFKPNITLSTIRNLISAVNRYPGEGGFLKKLRSKRPMTAVKLFTGIYTNPALTWDDLAFLRQNTRLPIFLKGILHPDNAQKAIDYGMDGIVVSNHGGRQVDGAIGAVEALPAISKVVNKQIPIVLDSGIRGGADVFKALALGATAVGLGRPYIYGLALAGQAGVYEVIRQLQADFELTMALAGCKNMEEITSERLWKDA